MDVEQSGQNSTSSAESLIFIRAAEAEMHTGSTHLTQTQAQMQCRSGAFNSSEGPPII